jgi:hypothetical protein
VSAEGEPTGGLRAFGSVDVVSGEGIAGEAKAGAAISEFLLEESAESASKDIGCGVRVPELDDANELGFGVDFKLVKLIEEGPKCMGVFDADFSAGERTLDAVDEDFAAGDDGWRFCSQRDGCSAGGGC